MDFLNPPGPIYQKPIFIAGVGSAVFVGIYIVLGMIGDGEEESAAVAAPVLPPPPKTKRVIPATQPTARAATVPEVEPPAMTR